MARLRKKTPSMVPKAAARLIGLATSRVRRTRSHTGSRSASGRAALTGRHLDDQANRSADNRPSLRLRPCKPMLRGWLVLLRDSPAIQGGLHVAHEFCGVGLRGRATKLARVCPLLEGEVGCPS